MGQAPQYARSEMIQLDVCMKKHNWQTTLCIKEISSGGFNSELCKALRVVDYE